MKIINIKNYLINIYDLSKTVQQLLQKISLIKNIR